MINPRAISIAVAVALAMLAAVQLASPESLGISPVAARWLGIVATGLGLAQTFLPRAQGPTKDPETLIERISALPSEDRIRVAETLAYRAERRRSPSTPLGPPPPPPPMSDDEIVRRHEGLG